MRSRLDRPAARRPAAPRPAAARGNGTVGTRIEHVPLADPVPAPALGEIDMDMLLVMAVRARPEHGREARAGVLAQSLADILGHLPVGPLHELAVGEPHAADIERIGIAMLAGARGRRHCCGRGNRRRRNCRCARTGRTGLGEGRRDVVAHPMRHRFRHRAAHGRRRRHAITRLLSGSRMVSSRTTSVAPQPRAARVIAGTDWNTAMMRSVMRIWQGDGNAGRIGVRNAQEVRVVQDPVDQRHDLIGGGRPRTRQRHAAASARHERSR